MNKKTLKRIRNKLKSKVQILNYALTLKDIIDIMDIVIKEYEVKDNPVPSIDKIKCHVANSLVGIGLGEVPIKINDRIITERNFSISEIIDVLNEKNYLQNGVENDNVNP
jgi:hypothetical protein